MYRTPSYEIAETSARFPLGCLRQREPGLGLVRSRVDSSASRTQSVTVEKM
jgi:hypothetical protein